MLIFQLANYWKVMNVNVACSVMQHVADFCILQRKQNSHTLYLVVLSFYYLCCIYVEIIANMLNNFQLPRDLPPSEALLVDFTEAGPHLRLCRKSPLLHPTVFILSRARGMKSTQCCYSLSML